MERLRSIGGIATGNASSINKLCRRRRRHILSDGPVCVDVTAEVEPRTAMSSARTDFWCAFRSDPPDLKPWNITQPGFKGSGRRFGTSPVGFFGLNGEVNLVFGSGDFEHLDKPDATNYLFKGRR